MRTTVDLQGHTDLQGLCGMQAPGTAWLSMEGFCKVGIWREAFAKDASMRRRPFIPLEKWFALDFTLCLLHLAHLSTTRVNDVAWLARAAASCSTLSATPWEILQSLADGDLW